MTDLTAAALLDRLRAAATPEELAKLRKRLADDEPVFGVRMGTLFALAKEWTPMPDAELERLFAEAAYEPRMAAYCILDFRSRKAPGDRRLLETYVRHHDRISAWDMVDRAAPRVVGSTVAGGPHDLLHELAASDDPLRRRTAITAPLWFVKRGSDADLAAGFDVAATLHADPEPVVTHAVGIYLAHAGGRDPSALDRFLEAHESTMPRPAVRLATRKR